jgi:hypothetical protein
VLPCLCEVGFGGAISSRDAYRIDISDCVFRRNQAAMGDGGAVSISSLGDQANLDNCPFFDDEGGRNGGAIASDLTWTQMLR